MRTEGDERGQRIYLADDDDDDCFLFETVIKEHFPHIVLTCFFHGDSLLTDLETASELPRVIFLDYWMPRQTGPQVVARLQQDPRLASIPIVLLTGQTQTLDAIPGVWRMYTKPNSLLQLQILIAQTLTAL